MRILVQKFGGTSVGTPEARERVANKVKAAVEEGYSVVVVVSAMGRTPAPYATDTLEAMARSILPDTEPRYLDLLMSCGETIASVILGNTIAAAGLKMAVLTAGQAGIVTNDNYGNAEVMKVDPHRIIEHLEIGYVVVVPGFQGVTEGSDVTTLGRGGSDTTAAIMGAALNAEWVDIYTDVDGVKTADPRLVPDAATIKNLTFEEICQMAYEGAKVVHPRAVEVAMRHNVPMRVKSTFDDSPGTIVTSIAPARGGYQTGHFKPVTGITHIPNLCYYHIPAQSRTQVEVFRRLAASGVSVDMVSVSPSSMCFVVRQAARVTTDGVIEDLGLEASVRPNCAKVSIVGTAMRDQPGVMAAFSEALFEAEIEVLETTDSNVTISCLIPGTDMASAARALHAKFELSGSQQTGGAG